MAIRKWTLTLVRGALIPKRFYWLKAKDTPYDISGGVAALRVKPEGQDEFEVGSPIVEITDGPAGEITIAFDEATVDGYSFERAEIALQVDSKILQTGRMRIRNFYDG
ncbi:MAG TPA: hypothetical protein VMM38_01320 [Aridibacter sp.]|nr:hypothetical protein [Aridibacter sp.]